LAGDILWLRLACAAGLVIGIAQQLALLALSIRMLGTFWIQLSAATTTMFVKPSSAVFVR
jgi:hypothetical protein